MEEKNLAEEMKRIVEAHAYIQKEDRFRQIDALWDRVIKSIREAASKGESYMRFTLAKEESILMERLLNAGFSVKMYVNTHHQGQDDRYNLDVYWRR